MADHPSMAFWMITPLLFQDFWNSIRRHLTKVGCMNQTGSPGMYWSIFSILKRECFLYIGFGPGFGGQGKGDHRQCNPVFQFTYGTQFIRTRSLFLPGGISGYRYTNGEERKTGCHSTRSVLCQLGCGSFLDGQSSCRGSHRRARLFENTDGMEPALSPFCF